MKDRELLELAAKAGGINGAWVEALQSFEIIEHDGCFTHWNALIDDADAFRLAVALDISTEICAGIVECSAVHGKDYTLRAYEKDYFDIEDSESARSTVRKTITKVAAEIGRAMK